MLSLRRAAMSPSESSCWGSGRTGRSSSCSFRRKRAGRRSMNDKIREEPVSASYLHMSTRQAWDRDRALVRIRELENLPGALLPVLHALQDEFGYVDPA